MEFKTKLNRYKATVERAIDSLAPPANTPPQRLHEAMRYSLEAGGKRLRPVLLLSVADGLNTSEDPLPAAVALECLHTYTLIHDDLPCMDNGEIRRGKPASHLKFDEATAVLAGDSLNTLAFSLLARHYRDNPPLAVALIETLATAAGSEKLVAGQMEDIMAEKTGWSSPEQIDFIHRNKTAALITAALTMGGHLGKADESELKKLGVTGLHLGIAYQIIDDLLDATGDTETVGKSTGADVMAEKATLVQSYGIKRSREMAKTHTRKALATALRLKSASDFLAELIRSLEHRIQ